LSRYLLPVVFCGPPAYALGAQLRAFFQDRALRLRGLRAEAEILARGIIVEHLEGQEYLDTSKTRRVTTLRFTTQDQQTLTYEEDLGTRGESFAIGAKVPVWYDPDSPARHVVGAGTTRKSVLGVALLGLPFFLSGLWILFDA
jgi:hypothetical protein